MPTLLHLAVSLVLTAACSKAEPVAKSPHAKQMNAAIEKLVELHRILPPPQAGDWLGSHDEPGQTFNQWLEYDPTLPGKKRNTLYLQPIGKFSGKQAKIAKLTAEYMGLYFGLPVKVAEALPLSVVIEEARRVHPDWGVKQLLTSYILDHVLKPRLPDDAAAVLGLTTMDLWPGKGWNFVFGQASLVDRVGVWSMNRYGSLEKGPGFKKVLLRTIKTATHETGHMFSLLHCTAYKCNMCGSNHLDESDAHPLWLCPHCMVKVCTLTNCDPKNRYLKLAEFAKEHLYDYQEKFFLKSAEALTAPEK